MTFALPPICENPPTKENKQNTTGDIIIIISYWYNNEKKESRLCMLYCYYVIINPFFWQLVAVTRRNCFFVYFGWVLAVYADSSSGKGPAITFCKKAVKEKTFTKN